MTRERESIVTILEAMVRRAAVDASIRAARHPGHDPARWALPLVAEADVRADGAWRRVMLTVDEARRLWLPPHAGEACHGDAMPLAGGAGAGLGDAVEWLARHRDEYARRNPTCWSRISAARDGAWGPLVLAPFPVGDRTAPPAGAALIVVDGLHRALGWGCRQNDGEGVGSGSTDDSAAFEAFVAGA